MPENPHPDDPVFLGGGTRPNQRFQQLCELAGIKPKLDAETGQATPWLLTDLRKTCATYYDEHLPESSIEILGHSVAGVTYRHYAHRAPRAFKAITTTPFPQRSMPYGHAQQPKSGSGKLWGRLPLSGQPRWGGPFSNLPLCSSTWYAEGRGQANRDDRCR